MTDIHRVVQYEREEHVLAMNYTEVMLGVRKHLTPRLKTIPKTQDLRVVASELRQEYEQRVEQSCGDPMLKDLLLFLSPRLHWIAIAQELVHGKQQSS